VVVVVEGGTDEVVAGEELVVDEVVVFELDGVLDVELDVVDDGDAEPGKHWE